MATGTYNTAEERVNAANAQALSGQVGGAQTASGIVTQDGRAPISSTITPASLAPSTPVTLPTVAPSTAAAGLSGHTDQTVINGQSALDKQLADKVATDTAAKAESKSALSSIMDRITGVQTSRADEEAKANISELSKLANDSFTALQASKRAQQKEVEAIQQNTGGMSASALSGEINRVNSKYANEQADLSIAYDVANRNYTNVQATVDRKIQLQLEPLQTQLQFQTTFFNDNKDALSKSEQNQLQGLIDKNKTSIEDKKAVGDLITEGLKTNPAAFTPEVIKDLTDNATDKLSASQILAKHRVSLQDPLDQAYKHAQIDKLRADSSDSDPSSTVTITNPDGTKTTTTSQGVISSDAQDVLEGRNTLYNIRQTMGRTNKAAAYMLKLRNDIRSKDPQFDFVASDAGGKSVSSTYVQKATASINSVLPNIDKIVALSNQVPRIGVTGVDGLIQKGGLVLNNKKVANFKEAQNLIADEIGVALGAGTVSDMKLQLGFDVTNPNVSQEVFASNMAVVKEFLENRKKGLDSLRYKSATVNSPLGTGSTNTDPLGLFP